MEGYKNLDPLDDLEEIWEKEGAAVLDDNALNISASPEDKESITFTPAKTEGMEPVAYKKPEEAAVISRVKRHQKKTNSLPRSTLSRHRRETLKLSSEEIKELVTKKFEERKLEEEANLLKNLGFEIAKKEQISKAEYRRSLRHIASGTEIKIEREWALLSKIITQNLLKTGSFKDLCKKSEVDPQFLLDICWEYNCIAVPKITTEDFIKNCTTSGYSWTNPKSKEARYDGGFPAEEIAVATNLGFTCVRKNKDDYSRIVLHNSTSQEITIPHEKWTFISKVLEAGLEKSEGFEILCEASREDPALALRAFQEYRNYPNKKTTPVAVIVTESIDRCLEIFKISATASKKRRAENSPGTSIAPSSEEAAANLSSSKKRREGL